MSKVLKRKASTQQLDNLHNKVAEAISYELASQTKEIVYRDEETGEETVERGMVDVKLLSVAIKFLKDNDITAEAVESTETKSLAQSIKQIAEDGNTLEDVSVEDMIAIAQRAE